MSEHAPQPCVTCGTCPTCGSRPPVQLQPPASPDWTYHPTPPLYWWQTGNPFVLPNTITITSGDITSTPNDWTLTNRTID